MTRGRWLVLTTCLWLFPGTTAWAKDPRPSPVPGSVFYLDAKNGFRDLKFGSALTKDMELARVDGEQRIYQRPHDSLDIGDGKCKQILPSSISPVSSRPWRDAAFTWPES